MTKLITFITPSRRLDNIRGFFENIESTVSDPSCVEVLIKFDDDQPGVKEFIEKEISIRPFTIKYIITPRLEGIYSVWVAMEQLFFQSDPDSYFVQIISDEPRFLTSNWDLILRKYVGFYKDDVFRLRLSEMKNASYSSHYECTFRPDSFPIYTRRWLELTEGSGDCWGSDAYQQCVAFQLSMGPGSYLNIYREQGLCRDIPIYDIKLGGLEFCVGVSSEEQRERHKRNLKEWARLTTFPMQEHFSYLARRINAYVWARENNIENFKLVKHETLKTVAVETLSGHKLMEFNYAVSRVIVYSQNFVRYFMIKPRHTLVWFLSGVKRRYNDLRVDMHQARALYAQKIKSVPRKIFRGTLSLMKFAYRSVKSIIIPILNLLNFILGPLLRLLPSRLQLVMMRAIKYVLQAGMCVTEVGSEMRQHIQRIMISNREKQQAIESNISLKRRIRLLINKMIQIILVPYYFISNRIDKQLKLPPPGVSVLYTKHPKMPGRIPVPTIVHVDWLKEELSDQQRKRLVLRDKIFNTRPGNDFILNSRGTYEYNH